MPFFKPWRRGAERRIEGRVVRVYGPKETASWLRGPVGPKEMRGRHVALVVPEDWYQGPWWRRLRKPEAWGVITDKPVEKGDRVAFDGTELVEPADHFYRWAVDGDAPGGGS